MSLLLSRVAAGIAPSATLQLNAAVSLLKKRGVPVLSLGAGEPDFPTPEPICEAAIRAIRDGQTCYTDVGGIFPLRQAVCEQIEKQKGVRYAPDEIIVGAGAKQVLFEALKALLDSGNEVLLPIPCWVSYTEMIRMAGGVPVLIEATPAQGFLPDVSRLAAAVTPRTKALILNTPSNPTGVVYPEALLWQIMLFAKAHDLYVISDEIYESLVYDDLSHVSPAALSEDAFARTIVVSGLSKSYAMTGWRVGYAAGPKRVIAAMTALQSHMSGNINTIAQYAALEALRGDQSCVQQMAATFFQRRQTLLKALEKEHLQPAAFPQGAFYALLDVRPYLTQDLPDDLSFAEALLKGAHVAVVPGSAFYAPGFLRLSYAVHEDIIAEAVARIGDFIRRLK